jgi:plastocyanin
MRTAKLIMLAPVLLLIASACSSSNTPSSSPSNTPAASTPAASPTGTASAAATVQATDQKVFDPTTVTINSGQAVSWQNNGSLPHTVTFDNGPSFNQNLDSGSSVQRTFSSAGTFKYHCLVHGASMSGTVIVK